MLQVYVLHFTTATNYITRQETESPIHNLREWPGLPNTGMPKKACVRVKPILHSGLYPTYWLIQLNYQGTLHNTAKNKILHTKPTRYIATYALMKAFGKL